MAVAAVTECPTWCVEASGVTVQLSSVWAATASDVFAVGDGGTILRRTNDSWTAMTSGTSRKLRGVWGTSSSDVWAVGVQGTILHFDGAAWSPATAPTMTTDQAAVWGSSSSEVFFAGQGVVLHLDGSDITSNSSSGSLLSLSGTAPEDAWAVGESAGVRHFDGEKWSSKNPGTGASSFYAVLAIARDDVWVTELVSGKETVHWDGTTWVPFRTTTSGLFYGLSALGSSEVWGAGVRFVGHWTGAAWTVEAPFATGTMLRSVTTAPGNVWVVGSGGLIAHHSL
jgi:hypothetical protein